MNASKEIYGFGEFRLVSGEQRLYRETKEIELSKGEFSLLLFLVKNAELVCTYDAIKSALGLNPVVGENYIKHIIYKLRKILKDDRRKSRYIESVPGKGYIFNTLVIRDAKGEFLEYRSGMEQYKHLIAEHDDFRRTGDILNNKYKLQGFVGSGGMGAVYLAENLDPDSSDRFVVVKILKPDVLRRNSNNLILFENEFKTASTLGHPNIVRIFDSGTDENTRTPYMVMEILDGITMQDLLTKQQVSTEMAIDIFKQICEALQYAHSKLVIHSDIKPANVLLIKKDDGSYTAKVIDFGLAKLIASDSGTTVTRFGGTLQFCSPEHFGGKLTYRSDIYSLGATLYFMLAGVIPFGSSYIAAKQHPNWEMPAIPSVLGQNPNLPSEIDGIIQKALSKDPFQRQQSVDQLFQEFRNAFESPILKSSGAKISVTGEALENIRIRFRNGDIQDRERPEVQLQNWYEHRFIDKIGRNIKIYIHRSTDKDTKDNVIFYDEGTPLFDVVQRGEILQQALIFNVGKEFNSEQLPLTNIVEAVNLANQYKDGFIIITGYIYLVDSPERAYEITKDTHRIIIYRDQYEQLTEEIVLNQFNKQIKSFINSEF